MLDDVLCSGVFNAHADFDELSQGLARVHYFVDRLRDHHRELVAALDKAQPAAALWSEFKAAEAEINAARAEGPMPDDHPARLRWIASRDAIASARPSDVAGLVVQLRFLLQVLDGFDPKEEDEAMLAHVGAQLEAMAEAA